MDLIGKTNVYFARSPTYNAGVIETIALWVSRMLRMFGLGEGENTSIGWGKAGDAAAGGVDVSE
jgi:cysteinyl-tRNA synthetase